MNHSIFSLRPGRLFIATFFALLLSTPFSKVQAQSNDAAVVLMNGKVVKPAAELSMPQKSNVNIVASRLKPDSEVFVKIKAGFLVLRKFEYDANAKGEINCPIATGNRKARNANIVYTAVSGKKVEIKVKIRIE